jgi:pimeloyl-ACP methyl ester carboxylesterase
MRFFRWTVGALVLGCVAVLLAYWIKDPERRTLDDKSRTEAPGHFVRLADGLTHYETAGPGSGPIVVLAAAFSVPAYISDSLYQGLGLERVQALRRTRAAIAVAPRQEQQIRELGRHSRPVLVLWGRQDRVAPISENKALLAAMPRATFIPVDSAGHLPHLEPPAVVVGAVVRFLRAEP